MDGAAAGGIEQRRGIAAMHRTDRIVGVLPGLPAKTALPASTSTNSKSSATKMPGLRPEAIECQNLSLSDFICFHERQQRIRAAVIGIDQPSGLPASAAAYSKVALMVYDLWVTHFSNRYVWRCPVEVHRDHYRKWIGKRHLEVGVGTGYYLSGAILREVEHVALLDPNPMCLAAAKRRIGSASLRDIL